MRETSDSSSKIFGVMTLGLDARNERGQDQDSVIRQSPSISMGLGQKPFLGLLEYTRYEDGQGGNQTLSVRRQAETAMAWFQWHADEAWAFRPFIGLGLGAHREAAETRLYNALRRDEGAWNEAGAGSFGLRLAAFSPVWLSLEGRLLFTSEMDPNPTVGGVLRFGFVME